jgi:hypothetical protein
MTVSIVPSMIRPLEAPWPEEGLTVDGCTLSIHIGDGQGVVIGLSVEDAYRVGSALATFAVEACKLAWTETIGQA